MITFKIVVLGSGSVGKSAITLRFIHGRFVEQYDPTIEDNYRHQVEVDGQNYILEILDTAGTEQFAQLRNLYVKNGMGFVLVFSLASKSSFLEISELREQIVRVKESTEVPMVVVGNKADLEEVRQVARKEAETLCRNFGCEYIESSAKTNTNIDLIFHTLVRIITSKMPKRRPQRKSRCSLL
jgi:small GTP-binding protein